MFRNPKGAYWGTKEANQPRYLALRVRPRNIYAAQASDGDNIANDTGYCVELLENELLPVCQFYAYVEILTEQEVSRYAGTSNGKELWRGYREIDDQWSKFSMKHIAKRSDIYPVFRELFSKNEAKDRVA